MLTIESMISRKKVHKDWKSFKKNFTRERFKKIDAILIYSILCLYIHF